MPRRGLTMAARIAWHADRIDESLASIRYRMLQPIAALQARGMAIEPFDPARDPARYDAILFCKSYGERAVEIAEAAKRGGTALIYDMCDNLFAANRVGHASDSRIRRLRTMLSLADHVTFSTDTLADQIAAEAGLTVPRTVIPDTLDIDPSQGLANPGLRERWELARLRRFLARHPEALHCVWFGKSLGKVSGYVHIDAAAAELRAFARHAPVTLTVISNDRLNFLRSARGWRLPVHYMPWTQATAPAAIGAHRVAVIPLENNSYTAGKTLNRPATALLLGLGVVADAIPSYDELRPFLTLGDWQSGLECYRAWSPETQAQIAAGRAHLAARYGPDAVAGQWAALIEQALAARAA